MDELFPMMYFQGNQFYPFVPDWKEHSYGRIVAPGNVALAASAFLILSSALVIRTLRLEKPLSIVLCCGFLATFETLAFVNGMFLLSLAARVKLATPSALVMMLLDGSSVSSYRV